MKKSKLIISILIGLLVVGVVSAAMVSYLSNTAQVTLDVDSPMTIVFDNEGNTDTLTLDVLGGDTIEYTTLAKNNAENSIEVYKVLHEITSDGYWTGNEM